MAKKVEFKDVVQKFESKNLKLLETDFINSKTSMNFYCEKHDYYGQVKWSEFKQNKGGCKICNKKKPKLSTDEIRKEVESEGHLLISKEYRGSREPIIIGCMSHGEFTTTYASFRIRKDNGCPKCASDKASIRYSTPYEEIVKEFYDNGFILIETGKIEWNTPVKCICLNHEDYGFCYISRANIKKSGCKLCSRENKSGENNHAWKGGATSENSKIRASLEYQQWRDNVFKRDNYTCQCCDTRGGELNAHHIFNFSTHPNLRIVISNGVTLCKNCHSPTVKGSYHNIYTQFDNTLEQLQEYFNTKRTELNLPLVSIKEIVYKDTKTEIKDLQTI